MENIWSLVLDDDMLWEIMLRLPTKSLMKFKCVSKQYNKHCNKITRDPFFVKSYRCGFQSLLILTYYGCGTGNRIYRTCSINTKDKQVEAYCPFPIQDDFRSSTNIVNGLIGFYKGVDHFKLCNIATGEFLYLPITSPEKIDELLDLPSSYSTFFSLGFEPGMEVYKVLRLIKYSKENGNGGFGRYSHLHICTLGGGGGGGCLEWRSLDPTSQQRQRYQKQNICINGYFYMWGRTEDPHNYNRILWLLAVDLSSETIIEISLPDSVTDSHHLVQLGGNPAFIKFSLATKMANIWILENQETWKGQSLELTGTEKYRCYYISTLVYIGTLPTGELLLTEPLIYFDGCCHPRYRTIYKYDHKQNKLLNWIQVDVGGNHDSRILYYEHNILALGSLI